MMDYTPVLSEDLPLHPSNTFSLPYIKGTNALPSKNP